MRSAASAFSSGESQRAVSGRSVIAKYPMTPRPIGLIPRQRTIGAMCGIIRCRRFCGCRLREYLQMLQRAVHKNDVQRQPKLELIFRVPSGHVEGDAGKHACFESSKQKPDCAAGAERVDELQDRESNRHRKRSATRTEASVINHSNIGYAR